MTWRMSSRAGRRGDVRWWLASALMAGSAAAATYFFDPGRGRSRRQRFAERTGHLARTSARRVVRRARYVTSALSQRARHRILGTPPGFADGRMLLDRVESKLFTDPTIPRGPLAFEVEGTTVVLRGQLESQEQIDRVATAVRKIPGVGGVRNLLHRFGTPAPDKLAALITSAQAAAEERWREEPPPDVDSEAPVSVGVGATTEEV